MKEMSVVAAAGSGSGKARRETDLREARFRVALKVEAAAPASFRSAITSFSASLQADRHRNTVSSKAEDQVDTGL